MLSFVPCLSIKLNNTWVNVSSDCVSIYFSISLKEYFARGTTALLDAIGKTIVDIGTKLRDTPDEEKPSKVIFVIITDGDENASMEFSYKKIKEMISIKGKIKNKKEGYYDKIDITNLGENNMLFILFVLNIIVDMSRFYININLDIIFNYIMDVEIYYLYILLYKKIPEMEI